MNDIQKQIQELKKKELNTQGKINNIKQSIRDKRELSKLKRLQRFAPLREATAYAGEIVTPTAQATKQALTGTKKALSPIAKRIQQNLKKRYSHTKITRTETWAERINKRQ